jgi:hypothetical protein
VQEFEVKKNERLIDKMKLCAGVKPVHTEKYFGLADKMDDSTHPHSARTGTEQSHTYRNTKPQYWNAQQNNLQVVIVRGTLDNP